MNDIYPEPPHLAVALYCQRPEAETFALLHDVVTKFGCQPTNILEVAPVGQQFELLSDLGGIRKIMKVDSTRYAQLVAGHDSEARVLRAAFDNQRFGKVVVEYVQRVGPGRHPIAVSIGSGSLGVPEFLWTAAQRRDAYSMADWSRALLEAACSRCDALYGAIGVEFSLPTPWQVETKRPRLPTELFVSRQLVEQGGVIEESLRRAFVGGEVLVWGKGVFLSGWAPFNASRTTVSDPSGTGAAVLNALRPALHDCA